ncbi:anion permease [Halorientalis brevis]|uniref:Phosphate transporter n=1 Tax=Halorientalis brevis TaxID=1126241 RepID=A0ABD6C982_9EURY|nr:inorganic phosphate transporter [Halorientalis brevis]
MVSVLLAIGLLVAVFVGFNIGGSSTGVAFGPAVGAKTISKFGAAVLMTVFALLGGITVGTEVVKTMGGEIVPQSAFTIEASIAVLFFIGFALFLSNIVGVPASTSMTAVGAIAGLGLAQGTLNWAKMGEIVSWWLVSPLAAFWVSGVVGRYFYPRLVEWFAITQSEGSLLAVDRSGAVPRPTLGPGTTQREFIGTVLVILIGCYMAFSAGASNVANAVAPLVGSNQLGLIDGILLGGAAIGLGAFTIARRTMDTVGNDLTDLPILAALVVATVSSTLVTFLSALGIPASFVIIATMSIVGLGWGRATRTVKLSETVKSGGKEVDVSVGALTADADDAPTVGGEGGTPSETDRKPIGEEESEDIPKAADLFEPSTTARVVFLQNIVPGIATAASYLIFRFVPLF